MIRNDKVHLFRESVTEPVKISLSLVLHNKFKDFLLPTKEHVDICNLMLFDLSSADKNGAQYHKDPLDTLRI